MSAAGREPDRSAVRERLGALRAMLAADEHELRVDHDPGSVVVEVVALPGACADCLVPAPLLRSMVVQALDGLVHPGDVVVRYPADGPGR